MWELLRELSGKGGESLTWAPTPACSYLLACIKNSRLAASCRVWLAPGSRAPRCTKPQEFQELRCCLRSLPCHLLHLFSLLSSTQREPQPPCCVVLSNQEMICQAPLPSDMPNLHEGSSKSPSHWSLEAPGSHPSREERIPAVSSGPASPSPSLLSCFLSTRGELWGQGSGVRAGW